MRGGRDGLCFRRRVAERTALCPPDGGELDLLAYVEPAARVEQQVERSDGEYFATTLTGFDAQERRVWSLTSMHPFIVGYGDREVYNGSEMTRYIKSYGG